MTFYSIVRSTISIIIFFLLINHPSLNASPVSIDSLDAFQKGHRLLEKKQYHASQKFFAEALSFSPNDANLHLGLGLSEMGLARDKQAINSLLTAIKLDSTLSAAYNGLGLIYLRSMQFKKASNYFEQALRLNPDDLETHLWLAEAQMSSQRYQPALQHFEIALSLMEEKVQQFPDSTKLHKTLIEAYILSGKWEKALKQYDVLNTLDPNLAETMYQRIINDRNARDSQLAFLKQTFNVRKNRKARAALAFKIGIAYLSIQNFEKAQNWLEKSLRLDSLKSNSLNALAIVYLNLEQPDKAIDLLKKAALISPENEMILLNLGHAYYQNDRYQPAIVYFQKAIERNQNLANAYYGLAMAYYSLETNMKVLAIVHSDMSYSNELNQPSISTFPIKGMQKEKRYQNIIQSLRKAASLRPDLYQAQFALGMAYMEIKFYAKAIEAFNMSVRFNPKEGQYHLGLGIAYQSMGYTETAKTHIEKAIGLNPGLAVAHEHLGGIYISLNNFPEAIKSFLNAKTIAPKNASLYVILTKLYIRTGQKILAQKTAEQLAKLNPILYKKLKRDLRL